MAERCFAVATAGGTRPENRTFRAFTMDAASRDVAQAERWLRRCRAEGQRPDVGGFVALCLGELD